MKFFSYFLSSLVWLVLKPALTRKFNKRIEGLGLNGSEYVRGLIVSDIGSAINENGGK